MPELFLHIGTHKTGTTSIQRFCNANREALRARGVWYPPANTGNFSKHYAHHDIAHAIAGRLEGRSAEDAKEFFDRVRSKAGSDERVLISAEPMYRHVLIEPDTAERTGKPTRDQREKAHQRYTEAVRNAIGDFDVTVLVMVRRQDQFVESLYAEQVMSTGYIRPIERFITEKDLLLDYEKRLSAWAEVFGGDDRISLRIFDPPSMDSSIEEMFTKWLGVSWDESLDIGQRHNVSLPRTFVEFKRMMNDPKQPVAINNQYRRWVEQLGQLVASDDVPDLGRYYLQPRDRVGLLRRFESVNRNVAQRFLHSDLPLFDVDLTSELEQYVDRPRLTERDFRSMAKLLFRMIASDSG